MLIAPHYTYMLLDDVPYFLVLGSSHFLLSLDANITITTNLTLPFLRTWQVRDGPSWQGQVNGSYKGPKARVSFLRSFEPLTILGVFVVLVLRLG